MDARQKNTFRLLGNSYEDKDFHIAKRRPKDGVSFGMIPNTTINKLLDRQNRTIRAEGAVTLTQELEAAEPDKFALLLPYMGSFIKFLGGLSEEASPKVVLHLLECHEVLVQNAPQALQQHLIQAVYNILRISLDSKVQIKIECIRVMKIFMKACTPQLVIDILLPELSQKNAKIREDVVNFVIVALLKFPSQEFDLLQVCSAISPSLIHAKRRVRQSAFECMATIHQCLGKANEEMIWSSIEDMEKGIYDDVEEICEAVQYRLSRKVLPKITEDGYLEYGLQIPYNFQTRSIDQKTSKEIKTDYGPDVDWVLRGSGSLSRGSAGAVNHHSLGIDGASGQIYGSNVSLQGTPRRKKSSGELNRRQPIPRIRRSNEKASRSASPTPSCLSLKTKDESVSRHPRRSTSHDPSATTTPLIIRHSSEDVEHVMDDVFSEDLDAFNNPIDDKAASLRKDTYDTIPRAQSLLSLRDSPMQVQSNGAGASASEAVEATDTVADLQQQDQRNYQRIKGRPLSLVKEESESRRPLSSPAKVAATNKSDTTQLSSQSKDEKGQMQPRDKKPSSSFKRNSLVQLGRVKGQHPTQFDEEDEGMEAEVAPGAFKRPKSAYKLARCDLQSAHWQTEIEGLAAIVRLIKYHSEVILEDIEEVMNDLNHECKNLRSQVTRAAIQTFVIMFSFLGKDMEGCAKACDATLNLLLTKTADTNRFIRYDANEALDAFSEHCSIAKVIGGLAKWGVHHKNVVARTTCGRLLADISRELGYEAIAKAHAQKESKDAVELLFQSAALLMCDGSLDVRQNAKRIFSVLKELPEFQNILRLAVPNHVSQKIRKQLDSLQSADSKVN